MDEGKRYTTPARMRESTHDTKNWSAPHTHSIQEQEKKKEKKGSDFEVDNIIFSWSQVHARKILRQSFVVLYWQGLSFVIKS